VRKGERGREGGRQNDDGEIGRAREERKGGWREEGRGRRREKREGVHVHAHKMGVGNRPFDIKSHKTRVKGGVINIYWGRRILDLKPPKAPVKRGEELETLLISFIKKQMCLKLSYDVLYVESKSDFCKIY
jgi:hypothetical protein